MCDLVPRYSTVRNVENDRFVLRDVSNADALRLESHFWRISTQSDGNSPLPGEDALSSV